jgi:hypothetical protein
MTDRTASPVAAATPGPWVYAKIRGNYSIAGDGDKPGPSGLAEVNGLYPEAEANARLIAAAPALRDALAECLRALAGKDAPYGLTWEGPTPKAVKMARAALALVEGR